MRATIIGSMLAVGLAFGAAAQEDGTTVAFQVDVARDGIEGFNAPDDGLVAAGDENSVFLSGVSADAPSSGRPGIFVTIPRRIESGFSGAVVEVAVTARRPVDGGADSFAVAYSTADNGNSGWQVFPLQEDWQTFRFDYRVPEITNAGADFVGLLPDVDGSGGVVEVGSVRVSAVTPPDLDGIAFRANTGRDGISVFLATEGGVVTDGRSRSAQLSGVDTDAKPWGHGGIRVDIPPRAGKAVDGRWIRVIVSARRAATGSADRLAIAYSTYGTSSGWKTFDLSGDWQDLTFDYFSTLGNAPVSNLHFLPDPEGGEGAVEIRQVEIRTPARQVVASSYYNVAVDAIDLAPIETMRGALTLLGDRIVVSSREGRLFEIRNRKAVPLDVQVPLDYQAETWADADPPSWVSVFDIAAEPTGVDDVYDLYASYYGIDEPNRCVYLQLSRTKVSVATERIEALTGWEDVFRSEPCRGTRRPTGIDVTNATGGRVAFDANGVLLTVGVMFGGAQDLTGDYGKILRFDRETLAKTVVSIGHRNPQGLFVDTDGTIYETEHGPRGGDEINIIEQGRNYGWPHVSYGTNYGAQCLLTACGGGDADMVGQNTHAGYAKPVYVFVPSVATSQIVRITGTEEFPIWRGDFLLATLNGATVFRLHMVDGHVVLAEPVPLGARLRDMQEMPDGRIAVLADNGRLMMLSRALPLAASAAVDAEAVAELRDTALAAGSASTGRQAFAETCSGCHALDDVEVRNGPPLECVFARPFAAHPGFVYSSWLTSMRSRSWTPEGLDSLLSNPMNLTAGTAMSGIRVAEAGVRADLIAYLAGLWSPEACLE